jgi:hypothetical protein
MDASGKGLLRPKAAAQGKVPHGDRARWNLAYKLSRYGITQAQFDQLLKDRGYACGMCFGEFEDNQWICVDHDHACCPDEKKSCGQCIRGLLCVSCNTTLGQIERKYEMARAYLDMQNRRKAKARSPAWSASSP